MANSLTSLGMKFYAIFDPNGKNRYHHEQLNCLDGEEVSWGRDCTELCFMF